MYVACMYVCYVCMYVRIYVCRDDLSSWNCEFSEMLPIFTLKRINLLERIFLNALNYDLFVSPSGYAKYNIALDHVSHSHSHTAAAATSKQRERRRERGENGVGERYCLINVCMYVCM